MARSGRLDVTVDSTSSFLQTHLPYVVRNARMAVVHTGTVGGKQIELDEGLYSVEVTAPTGHKPRRWSTCQPTAQSALTWPRLLPTRPALLAFRLWEGLIVFRAFGSIAIAISNWKGSSVAVRWTLSPCRHC